MRVFFCLSNLCVPLILSLIEGSEEDFIVVTPQENLRELFTVIYDKSHVIYIKPFKSDGIVDKLLFLPKWLSYTNSILTQMSFDKNSSVYFFFVAFGLTESWLIKKLSSYNTVFYNRIIDISSWALDKSVKARVQKMYIKFIYGVSVDPKLLGGQTYWAVSDKFLEKINAIQTDEKVNWELVNKLTGSKFQVPNENGILYITGGVVEEGYVNPEEFSTRSDAILESLGESNVLLKAHPRYMRLYSNENNIKRIPSFIPINLILDKFNVVVGYSSAVLFEAANQGCLSISLMDLYRANDPVKKQSHKDYLTQNLLEGKVIYYPEHIQELKNIINSRGNEKN